MPVYLRVMFKQGKEAKHLAPGMCSRTVSYCVSHRGDDSPLGLCRLVLHDSLPPLPPVSPLSYAFRNLHLTRQQEMESLHLVPWRDWDRLVPWSAGHSPPLSGHPRPLQSWLGFYLAFLLC